ncbi:MAG: hypothetical protein GX594_18870 [Pirellulaceae bacterium]|nr:hypothetical protein [Pirellulaceae bacterium]
MLKRSTFIVGLLLVLSGCGRDLPEIVPVSGRVQFEGGPPPYAGRVEFLPLETTGKLPRRPGTGKFGPDGYFEVVSFNGTKGLVPGRYRVRIECLSHQPDPAPGEYEKANMVPADYEPPELNVDAEKGAIDDLIYDVPKKK